MCCHVDSINCLVRSKYVHIEKSYPCCGRRVAAAQLFSTICILIWQLKMLRWLRSCQDPNRIITSVLQCASASDLSTKTGSLQLLVSTLWSKLHTQTCQPTRICSVSSEHVIGICHICTCTVFSLHMHYLGTLTSPQPNQLWWRNRSLLCFTQNPYPDNCVTRPCLGVRT